MSEERLVEVARAVLQQSLALRPGERVLLVGNPEETSRSICDAYFRAAVELGGKPTIVRQTARGITEMSDPVTLAAISTEPDIMFSISTDKIGKDPHGLHIGYVGRDGELYDHIFDLVTDGDRRTPSGDIAQA